MILLDPDEPEAANGFPELGPALVLPSRPTLMRYLREAQKAVALKGEVSVLLTTDRGIRGLNRRFRKKDKATDVLSFPGDPAFGVAGDLAISVETAARQAIEQGHRLSVEVRVLMLHGLLHLAGFDHETDKGEMAARERRLRTKLGLPLGLIERSGDSGLQPFPQRRGKDGAPASVIPPVPQRRGTSGAPRAKGGAPAAAGLRTAR